MTGAFEEKQRVTSFQDEGRVEDHVGTDAENGALGCSGLNLKFSLKLEGKWVIEAPHYSVTVSTGARLFPAALFLLPWVEEFPFAITSALLILP